MRDDWAMLASRRPKHPGEAATVWVREAESMLAAASSQGDPELAVEVAGAIVAVVRGGLLDGRGPCSRADLFASVAVELASIAQHAPAEPLLVEAVQLADEHLCPMESEHRQALASVLAALGRADEALSHYEHAVEISAARDGETSPPTEVARYFLGRHLRLMGRPARALEVLPDEPSTAEAAIRACRALCFDHLGRTEEARGEAARAVSATSDSARAQLRSELESLLD